MKKLSDILLPVYIILAIGMLVLLVLDSMHYNPISDDSFFFVVLPLLIISGIFSKIESYKMILVKLTPLFLALLYIFYEMAICRGEGCGWMGLGAIVAGFLIVVLSALSALATFIYRRVSMF